MASKHEATRLPGKNPKEHSIVPWVPRKVDTADRPLKFHWMEALKKDVFFPSFLAESPYIYICFMGLDYSFTRFIIKEKIMKIEVPSDPSKISPFFVLFFQASATQAEVGKGATIWQADHASLEVDMSVKKLRFALTSEPWQRDVFRWFAVWMKNFPVISGLW